METFLDIQSDSGFGLNNIPFGVFRLISEDDHKSRCCTRIGNYVIDLSVLEAQNKLGDSVTHVFNKPYLNDFMEQGKIRWDAVRRIIQELFSKGSDLQHSDILSHLLYNMNDCLLLLPCRVGDYTDFYSSKNHAFNLGCMFRGKENALQPNWIWMPVGYHGRASSIVVSPASFVRPSGQLKNPDEPKPYVGKSKKMDFELEMVTVMGKSNKLGEPIDIKDANEHIFGYLLMNDVSCRDIQNWEYVPLGPFTAKNCITVVSPWIVTKEALEPFKIQLPEQDPEPLDYLKDPNLSSFDINLNVYLKNDKLEKPDLITISNMKYLYWSPAQQISHHTVTGCNLQVGDMLGSGTISGLDQNKESGSFIELSWNGKQPLQLSNGDSRSFWEDGDTIIITGKAVKEDKVISFGECLATIK